MQVVSLKYVDHHKDIQDSLDTFNRDFRQNLDLARDLLRKTTYWVYDPSAKTFGPSKFVGFQNMNLSDYAAARKRQWNGNNFDGYGTRKAIEKILGAYTKKPQLSLELIRWGQSLLGADVFDGIDKSKWKFVSL